MYILGFELFRLSRLRLIAFGKRIFLRVLSSTQIILEQIQICELTMQNHL